MRYAVVLDAGSTGSRVHSYRFKSSGVGALNLVDDTFEQLKPGLSSFAEVPSHPRINLATLYNNSSPTVHLRDLDAAEPSRGALPVSAAVSCFCAPPADDQTKQSDASLAPAPAAALLPRAWLRRVCVVVRRTPRRAASHWRRCSRPRWRRCATLLKPPIEL
jgi:hypothetical protein